MASGITGGSHTFFCPNPRLCYNVLENGCSLTISGRTGLYENAEVRMQQELGRTRYRFFYGYWILLVGFLAQVIMSGATGYAASLYVLPLQTEFGWGRAATMTGSMFVLLISGIASPFVGRLVYKWGAKQVIVVGAVASAISFVLLSLMHALWQYYLAYVVCGLGNAAVGVVPITMVINNWFKKRRGLAIGILGVGIGVGGILMPWLVSNYFMPDFGWRGSYLFTGIMAAAIMLPSSLWLIKERPEDMGLLPDNGETKEDKQHRISYTPEPGLKLTHARKTSAFWLMAAAFATFGFAAGLIMQNQVPHLEDIGFVAILAAFSMQAMGIGSAIGKFAFGWLCDHIRPKYTIIIGSALHVGALLILMNISSSSPVSLLWMYGILFGLGYGCWLPALAMNTSFNFGLIDYGVIFGIYNFVFNSVGAIGPVVGGHIFDATGNYHTAFLLCLVLYAIAILTMFLAHRPQIKKSRLYLIKVVCYCD